MNDDLITRAMTNPTARQLMLFLGIFSIVDPSSYGTLPVPQVIPTDDVVLADQSGHALLHVGRGGVMVYAETEYRFFVADANGQLGHESLGDIARLIGLTEMVCVEIFIGPIGYPSFDEPEPHDSTRMKYGKRLSDTLAAALRRQFRHRRS